MKPSWGYRALYRHNLPDEDARYLLDPDFDDPAPLALETARPSFRSFGSFAYFGGCGARLSPNVNDLYYEGVCSLLFY